MKNLKKIFGFKRSIVIGNIFFYFSFATAQENVFNHDITKSYWCEGYVYSPIDSNMIAVLEHDKNKHKSLSIEVYKNSVTVIRDYCWPSYIEGQVFITKVPEIIRIKRKSFKINSSKMYSYHVICTLDEVLYDFKLYFPKNGGRGLFIWMNRIDN